MSKKRTGAWAGLGLCLEAVAALCDLLSLALSIFSEVA